MPLYQYKAAGRPLSRGKAAGATSRSAIVTVHRCSAKLVFAKAGSGNPSVGPATVSSKLFYPKNNPANLFRLLTRVTDGYIRSLEAHPGGEVLQCLCVSPIRPTEYDSRPASGLPMLSASRLADSTRYLGSEFRMWPQTAPLPPIKFCKAKPTSPMESAQRPSKGAKAKPISGGPGRSWARLTASATFPA